MDRIITEILDSGYTKINDTQYQKIKTAYTLDLCIGTLSNNLTIFRLVRTYKNGEKIIIYDQKRRITKLLGHVKMVLDEYDSLCSKDHLIHNEIYCKYCEDYIRDNITAEKFCDFEGFVSVHNTQFGRCIIMIDVDSSYPVRDILKNMKKCNNCRIEYLSNNTIENGLDGTIEYISHNIDECVTLNKNDLIE